MGVENKAKVTQDLQVMTAQEDTFKVFLKNGKIKLGSYALIVFLFTPFDTWLILGRYLINSWLIVGQVSTNSYETIKL